MMDDAAAAKAHAQAALVRWREARRAVRDATTVPTRLDKIIAVTERSIAVTNQDVVTEVEALLLELSTLSLPVAASADNDLQRATAVLVDSLGRFARAGTRAGFAATEDKLYVPPGIRLPAERIAEPLEALGVALAGVEPVLEKIGKAQSADASSNDKQNALVENLLERAAVKIDIIMLKISTADPLDVSGVATLAQQLATLLESFVTTVTEAADRVSPWLSEEAGASVKPTIAAISSAASRLASQASAEAFPHFSFDRMWGSDLKQRIRERAYRLWEEEGCPEGRSDEYWARAMAEIHDELNHRIRERAYQLWEEEGRPEGDSDELWARAAEQVADQDRRIRERAYQIWLEEGCPEGRSEELWAKAEADINVDLNRRIHERVYRLWQEQGRPEGGSDALWARAANQMADQDRRTSERAYQIWLKQGRPRGRWNECWEIAAQEIEADDARQTLIE